MIFPIVGTWRPCGLCNLCKVGGRLIQPHCEAYVGVQEGDENRTHDQGNPVHHLPKALVRPNNNAKAAFLGDLPHMAKLLPDNPSKARHEDTIDGHIRDIRVPVRVRGERCDSLPNAPAPREEEVRARDGVNAILGVVLRDADLDTPGPAVQPALVHEPRHHALNIVQTLMHVEPVLSRHSAELMDVVFLWVELVTMTPDASLAVDIQQHLHCIAEPSAQQLLVGGQHVIRLGILAADFLPHPDAANEPGVVQNDAVGGGPCFP
mmetsp:Transcript_78278/g.217405  ORF Transcript_78278/g.217405 Transcript_78278/m.217405 type:complete len:264 (+) Transcript_78278:710-1501(+)